MEAGAVEIGESGPHPRFQDIEPAGGLRALGTAADAQSRFDTEGLEREVSGLRMRLSTAVTGESFRCRNLEIGYMSQG